MGPAQPTRAARTRTPSPAAAPTSARRPSPPPPTRPGIVSGVRELVVLKTTDSEFHTFYSDRYTTLVPTDDRIMASSVTAQWLHTAADVDWGTSYDAVLAALTDTFAGHYSLALQQTLYAMGEAVIDAQPEIGEVRFSMPNKHHFLVDLSPYGAREQERGLPRRRPAVRPHRGHHPARRRPGPRRRRVRPRPGVVRVARTQPTEETRHPVDQVLPAGQMAVYGLQHVMSMYAALQTLGMWRIGARQPLVQGTSFAAVASMLAACAGRSAR